MGPLVLDLGSLLLLMTDGVLEADSPGETVLGTERMLEVVRTSRHKRRARLLRYSIAYSLRTREPTNFATISVPSLSTWTAARLVSTGDRGRIVLWRGDVDAPDKKHAVALPPRI